jgi:hypothetical protein
MMFLPKYELSMARNLFALRGAAFFCTKEGLENWMALQQRVELAFRRHCTTRALARYVMEVASILALPEIQSTLVALHPGRKYFDNNGLYIILEK